MAGYYDTTPESVEAAMTETGIKDHGLVHALLERGNTVEKIKTMPPHDRLNEFLFWHGINGWTSTIIATAKSAGYVVGAYREIGPENDEQRREFLDGVVGAVDADRYAQHSLWADYAEEGAKWGRAEGIRYPWISNLSGLMTCVGTIGDLECWVSLSTAMVNGHKLLFYYGSGIFVHHEMIESWLEKNLPDSARGSHYPGGYNHTDAMNFCNIFHRMLA